MTDLNPLNYASTPQYDATDLAHLRALAICYYVWGGLVVLFSCLFIMHVVFGLLIASGRFPMSNSSQPPPPLWMGYMMASMGGCAIILGWTIGILNIVSGRCIARQNRRAFSLVMAGINCVSIPFGTVLGIFTFIVLLRPSVRGIYERSSPMRV